MIQAKIDLDFHGFQSDQYHTVMSLLSLFAINAGNMLNEPYPVEIFSSGYSFAVLPSLFSILSLHLYGGHFYGWLRAQNPEPYGSYGNGSAMRVSSAGWLSESVDETRRIARLTAEVTHNHPEGIKGAEATASAIFLARTGHGKDEIKDYVISEFGYNLSRSCDEIRPAYHHVESCQQTVF